MEMILGAGNFYFCFENQCWLMFRSTVFLASIMFGKNTRLLAKCYVVFITRQQAQTIKCAYRIFFFTF